MHLVVVATVDPENGERLVAHINVCRTSDGGWRVAGQDGHLTRSPDVLDILAVGSRWPVIDLDELMDVVRKEQNTVRRDDLGLEPGSESRPG